MPEKKLESIRLVETPATASIQDIKAPEKLAQLVQSFSRWLSLPDPGALLSALATVSANQMLGDPVWLLIVGAAGAGKSEILQSLGSIPLTQTVGTLTEASFLSGTTKRDCNELSSGGLLRMLGSNGIVVLKDFGSILSMRQEMQAAVLAALREIYDGSWTRHVGVDGGRTLSWKGKLGLVGAVTPTIDCHHTVMASLGERFLFYRLPEETSDELAISALHHTGNQEHMRQTLTQAVRTWSQGVRLPTTVAVPTADEEAFLVKLAGFVARARSPVERNRMDRSIELIPPAEAPGRLICALGQLITAMRVIGIEAKERRRLISKIGFDSIPVLRRGVIDHLAQTCFATTAEITKVLRHPRTTVVRALEDLDGHRIINSISEGWALSEWARERWVDTAPMPLA